MSENLYVPKAQYTAKVSELEADHEREITAKDAEIERLTKENASLKAQVERLSAWQTSVLRRRGLSDAPCDVCGYNGEGYYQPSTHSCASRAAKEKL